MWRPTEARPKLDMIKIVALIKRRPDVTLEQFCEYYEHHHAPLFHRSIPPEVADAISTTCRTTPCG